MWILFAFLFGMSAYMVYHLCYELIQHFGEALGWTFFGYYAWSDGVIPLKVLLFLFLDIAIRDIIPISIIVVSYIYGSTRIKRKYKLIPLSQHSPKTLATIEDVFSTIKVRCPECYTIQTEEPQAFIFGKKGDPKLVVTKGLLNLPSKEIKSVVCHELGHIMHNDMSFMTWGEAFIGALKIYVPLLVFYEICLSLLDLLNIWVGPPIDTLMVRLLFIILFLFIVPVGLINSVSRVREFFADAQSRIFMKSSEPLVSALVKISSYHMPKTSLPTRLTVAGSEHRRTKSKRILAYFSDTHPTLTTRLTSLVREKSVGKKTVVPNFEGAIWIGLSTAIFVAFYDEFFTATDAFWYFVGVSSRSMIWLQTILVALLPSCFICLFFTVFFRRGIFQKASLKSLMLYLKKAWKKIAIANIVFLIVYLPWGWYLRSPLLGRFESLPVNLYPLGMGFFIENCVRHTFATFFLSYIFIIIIGCIVGLYYELRDKKVKNFE